MSLALSGRAGRNRLASNQRTAPPGRCLSAPAGSNEEQPFMCGWPPRLARDHLACSAEGACSHVSGLLVQSGWTAGPDGVREPSPHHSNGIDVPMKSQVWLGCVGSTDCAITRHCSLASSRTLFARTCKLAGGHQARSTCADDQEMG